jgi:hypothetical protein
MLILKIRPIIINDIKIGIDRLSRQKTALNAFFPPADQQVYSGHMIRLNGF